MELEEMKLAWRELERRVESAETLALDYHKDRAFDRTRRVLRALGWGQVFQSLVWIAVVATVGPFWIEHRHVTHLLVAGLVLHAYGVLTICSSVVQLALIGRAYHTAAVIPFQRRLAELQRFRIVSTLVLGLPWWVLWVVATMVGAKWLLNVDVYAHASEWIWSSIVVGLAGIALTVWVARRLARRPPASPTLRGLVDDLAGRSLVRVTRDLDALARFERE